MWLLGVLSSGRAWPSSLGLTAWLVATLVSLSPQAMADKTAADYFIHSLPGQPKGPLLKMHAGHIEVDPEHNGNLFFWHFQNRHIANRQRTVIWLNGGPGCSSMDGALMELGPYRVKKDGILEYNEGSWDEFANVLFVDQPVGTGFSYVNSDSYLHELDEMAAQFVIFMEKWFTVFPEYEHDDLYFAGESYAGQYIPYIARAILDRNAGVLGGQHNWNLRGLLIGNGWIAPSEQYQSYSKFALLEGLIKEGTSQYDKVAEAERNCMAELEKHKEADHVDIGSCEAILSTILTVSQENGQCYNMYDVRLFDSYPSCGMNWPPDLTTVTPYLRRQDVINALHINPDKRSGWTECAGSVSGSFRAAHSKPSITLLPGILEAGVPIVLFSGAKDLICNHLGTEAFIHNMAWSSGTGFELSPGVWAPKRAWTFEGEPAGLYQEARNLTYVLFYNASHMVPFDWPRRTRDMLDRFIGVDIASIGGQPADSRIDGAKAGAETSVGGHPNSTIAEAEAAANLREAELKAYYRSGEAVLVVVLIAAGIFGWWVWRGRRKQWELGYMSVPLENGNGLESFRGAKMGRTDVEAGDFDVNELDTLPSRDQPRSGRNMEADNYSLGSDSEDGVEGDIGGRGTLGKG